MRILKGSFSEHDGEALLLTIKLQYIKIVLLKAETELKMH